MAVAPYSKTAAFGPGFLSAVPVTGWNAAAPIDALTPITFALIESVSLDFSFKLKELYSQSVYPIAGGASTGKVTGKAKLSSFSPSIMNALFYGASSAGAGVTVVQYAPYAIPSTPYQVTPAAPAAVTDLGVFYQTVTTGILQKQFAKVASGPAAGQYTFSAGVYTFAAADTGTAILISYEGANAGGSSFSMTNQLSGMAPQFQLNFSGVYGGQVYLFNFPYCCSEKLSFATKVNDWVGVEFDFEVFTGADPGSLGTVYMTS